VVEAIDALPEEFREVLVLSDLGDLKYGEIAQVIGRPVGTVKSRLFRARRLLQERLVEYARTEGYVSERAGEPREEV
jgi:RNA polymerase sigma-70 factor (ECF subfamily)